MASRRPLLQDSAPLDCEQNSETRWHRVSRRAWSRSPASLRSSASSVPLTCFSPSGPHPGPPPVHWSRSTIRERSPARSSRRVGFGPEASRQMGIVRQTQRNQLFWQRDSSCPPLAGLKGRQGSCESFRSSSELDLAPCVINRRSDLEEGSVGVRLARSSPGDL
jgi:hypothetical protein